MQNRVISLQELREIIPVSRDFMMLDRAMQIDEKKFAAWKNVTISNECFQGHFPGHPILPGVLSVESIAQLAEVAVWEELDPYRARDIYVKKLMQVKFRKPNTPGDRMLIELEVEQIVNGEALISATVKNSSGLACQAKLILAVRDRITDFTFSTEFNEFDKSEEIPYDTSAVMGILPHRYPFLFTDYVAKCEGQSIVSVKNMSNTDNIFRTYRDGYSVLSNTIQPEIISEAGAIHMLIDERFKGKLTYFMGIDEADSFEPVFPGDQAVLEVEIPPSFKRFGKGKGLMRVNGKIVSQMSMMFALVDSE